MALILSVEQETIVKNVNLASNRESQENSSQELPYSDR